MSGDALYDRLFPYYVEVCALSEIRKKPGMGIPLRSGIGGHSLLYLHGVGRDREAGYPVLRLREPGAAGVGISVNSHYRNANWVAADGPAFLWRGALAPGEGLSRAGYERTQALAKSLGILDGVEFHRHFFREKPAGMDERDYMYEISVATDYAARFGRDVFRARVPLDKARMAAVVDYLNGLNAPYRAGVKEFSWKVLNNNCCHVARNALAAAGVWAAWPTGQFFALAAFKFPVPKNEFVDLVLRANDFPLGDAAALHADAAARRALLEHGTLPAGPGALARAEPAVRENEVYDIDGLRLIFYDNPFWGPYKPRLKRIFSTSRYTDLRANLLHFRDLYAARGGARPSGDEPFDRLHHRTVARDAARLAAMLASLERDADMPMVVTT
jgi:hypothetical protein